MARIVIEETPRFHPSMLVPGQTYLIRLKTNLLTHAVYLRADKIYKVMPWGTRRRGNLVYAFRVSSSGQEVYLAMRRIYVDVIKEVTGLEGIIMAGGIETND